jgi:hypothetical protein
MDVVDLGGCGAPLDVGDGLAVRKDVLRYRVAVHIVDREGIRRRRAVSALCDAFVIDVIKIRGGHHYTNTWTGHAQKYTTSCRADLTHCGDYFLS